MGSRRHFARHLGPLEVAGYIFGMMFMERLAKAFEEAREAVVQYYIGKGKTEAAPTKPANDEDECDKRKSIEQ